ncbi:MAG: TIGR01212 family radical SAM protein [Butyrivibrio sp.]|nr:TIGR01212 family radical SAM protein [Butyrivibrio sp.]
MPLKLSTYLKEKYGKKIYRLSLSSGCTCPNRDGSVGAADGRRLTKGCTFCSEQGSGEFAAQIAPIDVQIEDAKARIKQKTDAQSFIAYFQSYTNTYGDARRLSRLYNETIDRDDIEILSIGTRPDCLGDDIMDMLSDLNRKKPVWVELGLQTIHEETACRIDRGYSLDVFEDAYRRLKEKDITVIVHVIMGLPGESREDMLETVKYLANLTPVLDGIKIQNLQILKGTSVYDDYMREGFHVMSMEEYTDLVRDCIALLPEETVVHRMTGDGPRRLLEAPLWSLDKKRVLNTLNRKCLSILR